ncbi:hypothetical protein QWZ13_14380 [Reinekea marina]|uniref:hypothetical protein n=1 Tax=Reinekea marina TaxID=1310421 RepID=UPI0025B31D4E|nr:hypothetical protein [Reinekea marina]MDN3650103.1 hypothetical protein [Reinekea marina]
MKRLPRYAKVEVVVLGIIVPTTIAGYALYFLLQSKAVFWGRSSVVYYQGSDAVFVSLLWIGLSLLFMVHFLARPLRLLSFAQYKLIMWVPVILLATGLVSAIVLV